MIKEIQHIGLSGLKTQDSALHELLEAESVRQQSVLTMVAASSMADPSVLACTGSSLVNVTTEGYPGARFHPGCAVVDEVERLAIARAKKRFGAQYANVQPHSGSSANAIVLFSLLAPGDVILGMHLDSGGHLTHGSKASVTGNYFRAVGYENGEDGRIDYQQVQTLAEQHRPKLIICGASSYPRTIDFARFRAIADSVGAYLLADISHIAGLVVAGLHPSPIDHAHFTTTSTYKQLYGPRGGLVLLGRDAETLAPNGKTTLAQMVQRGCFPYMQGTGNLAAIAGKACALEIVGQDEFRVRMQRVLDGASALSTCFLERGYKVLTGGTDNHMLLLDVLARGYTGLVAETALEECGIIVNRNRIPGDVKSARITSGLRFGTNTLAARGMGAAQMPACAALVDQVLQGIVPETDRSYGLDPALRQEVLGAVGALCAAYPIAGYPSGAVE